METILKPSVGPVADKSAKYTSNLTRAPKCIWCKAVLQVGDNMFCSAAHKKKWDIDQVAKRKKEEGIHVQVNARTWVFVKAGEDPEEVKQKWLAKLNGGLGLEPIVPVRDNNYKYKEKALPKLKEKAKRRRDNLDRAVKLEDHD